MSYNSKQYLAHEERRLEPDQVHNRGRRNTRDSLTNLWASAERVREIERMQREFEQERNKLKP